MQPSPQSNLKIFLSSLWETLGPLTLPLPLQPLGPGRPLISFPPLDLPALDFSLKWSHAKWCFCGWLFPRQVFRPLLWFSVYHVLFSHSSVGGDLGRFCYLSVLLLQTLVHTYLSPRFWWSGHRYAWEWTRWVEWSLCFPLDQTGGPAGARFPFLLHGSDFSATDTRFPSFKTQPSLRVSSGISSCFRLAFP